MANSLETLVVNELNRAHIRKGKKVAVLSAAMSTAVPAAITTGGATGAPITLVELTGFRPMGLLSKSEGIPLARDREKSDVMAIGYQDPVRSDFTTDTMSAQVVGLETNRHNIEHFLGVDLAGFTPNIDTGEVSFPQPTDGVVRQNRWMFLAQDGIGLDRYWWGRCFCAGVVAETDDQNLGSEDDPFGWPMTVSTETDTDLGYSVHHYFGGPGWKSRLESLGFAAA